MFPDPITPRSFPELLARLDYDPFEVMPGDLPPAPRVFARADQIQRARQRIQAGELADRHCFERLIASCELDKPLPPMPPPTDTPDWGGPLVPWLNQAFRNALAHALSDDPRHRERALEAMRLASRATARVPSWTGHEHHEALAAARAYDLLAAGGLAPDDDNAFREMLWTLLTAMDQGDHRHCNNHNSMHMSGRLALAAALGHRQSIHDVFYGHFRGKGWRYGMIHLLRHDFLADGMQWEGVPSYHMVVLTMVCECFTIMENLGVDLWRRQWPALMQDDGFDEHRGWGPKGNKSLAAAFDVLLYQAFTNGDYSLLHDQVLGNQRGAWVWWRFYNKAYEVFGEPRYAWALRRINRGQAASRDALPVWFEGDHGASEFVRIERRDYPEGESPLPRDRDFALVGRHRGGCSLFEMHGSAILRSDVADEAAPGAYVYWGPHCAGHRSPAALHLEIHALGRRVSTAPHMYAGGYGEPRHLTWVRSTIAHNTVTVDQQPMFPFDFDTQSLWECDRWRDTISDGQLEGFQPEADWKAVRVSNDNVYPGVRLDRTVVLAADYLLDVYRVEAQAERLLDWSMHCHGTVDDPAGGEPINLGEQRGYRHLTGAMLDPRRAGWADVPIVLDEGRVKASFWLGADGDAGNGDTATRLIVARDPEVDGRRPIGDLHPPEARTCLMLRTRGASALFVSVWGFGDAEVHPASVTGDPASDVTVDLTMAGKAQRWRCPMRGTVSRA